MGGTEYEFLSVKDMQGQMNLSQIHLTLHYFFRQQIYIPVVLLFPDGALQDFCLAVTHIQMQR